MQVRQSDIASWTRCPQQMHLAREGKARGDRERVLSATAFGTVIHHAAQVMEELHTVGREDACERAVETFEHYWNHANIGALVPGGVDVWLPRQTHGGLMIRGRNNLRAYYDWLCKDTGRLLALELEFRLPIQLGDREHVVKGTVDRLSLRKDAGRRPYLSVEDFKSGQKPTHLRHAFQWTLYSWASTQAPFWASWEPEDLAILVESLNGQGLALYDDGSGLPIIPRKGRWIALRDTFGVSDCGWRTGSDFARMKVALEQFIASNEAAIYPLSIKGDVCTYCPFAYDGSCGGVPLDAGSEGTPYSLTDL